MRKRSVTLSADDPRPARGPGAPGPVISRLVALGVTPNMVSWAGLVCSLAGGVFLAIGAGDTLRWEAATTPVSTSWWPVFAGLFIGLAAVADLLDGRLARHGNLETKFGAVLDSTLDRFGDMAVFIGCAVYYARNGNATLVLVSCLALAGAVQISYVKARAENFVDGVGIGFWQRGERVVAVLVGCFAGRIPTVLWISAIFPLFTVLRRVRYAYGLLSGKRAQGILNELATIAPWRQRRGSAAYVLFCAVVTAAIIGAPLASPFFYGSSDPLGALLSRLAP